MDLFLKVEPSKNSLLNKGDFAEFVAEYIIEQSDSDIDKEDMELMGELEEKVKPLIERTMSRSGSIVSEGGSDAIRKRLSVRSSSVISSKDKDEKHETEKRYA